MQAKNNAEWSKHNSAHMKLATAVKKHNDDMRERRRKGRRSDPHDPTVFNSGELASFAFTEALGERHSAGLDDSVPEAIDNFLAVPARFERFVAR